MRWRVGILSLALFAAFIGLAGAAPPTSSAPPTIIAPEFGAPSSAERAAFKACFQKSGKACLGRIRAACADRPGGETTAGMVDCANRERRLWEERVETLVASLRKGASPGKSAALDAALAQFAQWRSAKCAFAATLYEGGSLARVLAAECAMNATADWSNELARRLADESQ